MAVKKAKPPEDTRPIFQKVLSFLKEFGIVLGIFLVLNSFVIASFEVPTGSMENEIMTGDFLLVNKFVYGGTTPGTMPPFQVLPIFNIKIPTVDVPRFKLPSFWDVEKGDVIVFVWPGNRDEVQSAEFTYYLKRCIATQGDTLEIKDRIVFVNGKQVQFPRNVKFNYTNIRPKGYADERIFPPNSPFNEDNYGPLIIPKKGMVIPLSPTDYYQWKTFIRREKHTIEMKAGVISIDGKQTESYTVERDYVFGMGDNRDNSLDSRFWGFIPKEDVVGTPLVVYWSWDPDKPLINIFDKLSTVRLERVGNLVH